MLSNPQEWFHSTKEKLSPSDILTGLLDHGLFSDKVPACFTSIGLAKIASDTLKEIFEETDEVKLKKKIKPYSHDYIRYDALRDINIPRHLGIPHPGSYAVQALALSKHWQVIAKHCNQPDPSISRVHVRKMGSDSIFKMNYKGSEHYQLEEEEINWMAGAQFVVKADVASCYPSIYTHSIPWALHDKITTKKNQKITELAGNLLDKCTQNTRDGQTNGLLIGPHASSIISEIILTKIDTDLQKKYKKIVRHIDDYTFFADTFDEAEKFVKDLGLCLRSYEMSLNYKKTNILPLPTPSVEDWIHRINSFDFPKDQEIGFSKIRSFLDLALECSRIAGKSTPLSYAIKILAGNTNSTKLNTRAKRLYVLEVMNMALVYPYLVPLLDKAVFDKYGHPGLADKVSKFSTSLIRLGVRKLYFDIIAHAFYYALKHNVTLDLKDNEFIEIINLNDCISNVMLFAYATKHNLYEVIKEINNFGKLLKLADSREKDKNWLLIYQLWSVSELNGSGQKFLADLKSINFQFLVMPQPVVEVETPDESIISLVDSIPIENQLVNVT